jgi:hypothetical protein
MKKSELKQIIKEEINKILKENSLQNVTLHLINADDDPEHSVWAIFKNNKLIKSNFEDIETAKQWAKEKGYVVIDI